MRCQPTTPGNGQASPAATSPKPVRPEARPHHDTPMTHNPNRPLASQIHAPLQSPHKPFRLPSTTAQGALTPDVLWAVWIAQRRDTVRAGPPVRPVMGGTLNRNHHVGQAGNAMAGPNRSGRRPDPTQAFVRRIRPRLREPDATYFVTWRIASGQRSLEAAARDVVAGAIRHFDAKRYHLHAWVVMDDHVHVVVTPILPYDIDAITHSWRSFSAHTLCATHGRSPPIWQRGSHDRVLRADGQLDTKVVYVRANPAKRWPELSEYRWVWPPPG